jgi:cytoskeleton protein RodZ
MTKRPSRGDIQPDVSGNDGAGTTGQDLREQREALGLQLGDIAETLCIRLDFLKALEAGDYDALPGSAYAVGFVRSYARHLGMDSDKMAWQFKVEVSGETPTAKLDFLTPLQESRIPRGAIVLVTVLLAVTIYGVWYYMNARDLTFADIIPDVPLQFGRTAQAPAPVASTSVPAKGALADPSAPESSQKGDTVSPEEGGAGDGAASGPAASGASPPAREAIDAQKVVPPAPATPPPVVATPAPTAPPSPVAAPAPVAGAAAETAAPAAADAGVAPPAPAVEAAAVPSPAPVEAAPPKVSPRIEIRAKADSWIQVRTAGGTLLMTRIVSQGTSFVVPPQDGLKLTTGNAGGLEILVDGVVVPAIGPFGAVRRDVPLDPERLKAGTAVAR